MMGSEGATVEAGKFEGEMMQSDWDIAGLKEPQAVQAKGSAPD